MKTFSVIEYSSFFALRHNATGEEHPMGDGVGTLMDPRTHEMISPGTPGFVEMWEDLANTDAASYLEAYFPHLVEDDDV